MASLPDELRTVGLDRVKAWRKQVYYASQRWIRLRESYKERKQDALMNFDVVQATLYAAVEKKCERMRLDCLKVYNYLYKIGPTLFGEDLGVLPIIPVVLAFGALTTLVALVGYMKWIALQEQRLQATERADARRVKYAQEMVQIASETNSPEARAAALEAAGEVTRGVIASPLKTDTGGGFFSGLLPKLALGFAVYKFGPPLWARFGGARG